MPTYRQTAGNLWHLANDHARASRFVADMARGGTMYPASLLTSIALEFTLKAFLLARGVPPHEMQARVGTDLARAFDQAKRHGLVKLISISELDEEVIVALNRVYNGRDLDYLPHPTTQVPNLDRAMNLVERLHKGIHDVCLKNTNEA